MYDLILHLCEDVVGVDVGGDVLQKAEAALEVR
jgi:hypothetical protein